MSNRRFWRIFFIIYVTGILASAALWGYTVYLKDNCSIIDYIAGEPE
ncbi:MAG: hypothetical protein IJR00_09010 [Lachnospiraceae bacterium]|nr:hypothetical protein [Lachnospiraceae bacterium]